MAYPLTAADIMDNYASMNSGALAEDYEQYTLGKVKLEDFTKEFAAAFKQWLARNAGSMLTWLRRLG